MWCDGYFNPHRYDHLGFDEYTLRHACFGDDGDQNDSGSDPGQGDFVGRGAEKDEEMPTPEDFEGLVDSGQMTPEDVSGALAQAGGYHAKADPYADMIAHGYIAPPGKEDAAGVTPEELGFTPTFGYGSYYDPSAVTGTIITADGLAPGAFVSYDPGKVSDQQLGQSYADAVYGSRDIGSDIASLFGIGSPVEFDPNKGFYEGTTFDPFDSPLISLAISALNPGLGALYGLGKLASGRDPVGGALGMLGPAGRALSTGITGYELLTDKDVNVSNFVGLPGLGFDTSINLSDYYTSSPNKADPVDDFLGGVKDTVSGVLSDINPFGYDPTDPAPPSTVVDAVGDLPGESIGAKSSPTISDVQQQGMSPAAIDAAQAQAAAAAAAEALFGPNYTPGKSY